MKCKSKFGTQMKEKGVSRMDGLAQLLALLVALALIIMIVWLVMLIVGLYCIITGVLKKKWGRTIVGIVLLVISLILAARFGFFGW